MENLLGKLIVSKRVNQLSAFYGTWKFIKILYYISKCISASSVFLKADACLCVFVFSCDVRLIAFGEDVDLGATLK
jgi:hypothetical protein